MFSTYSNLGEQFGMTIYFVSTARKKNYPFTVILNNITKFDVQRTVHRDIFLQ